MPSQRLLKILDPAGHIDRTSVITSTRPSIIVWARPALRDWIASEIRAAGATPLLATAFRHVAWSLRPTSQPAVQIAVFDHGALSDIDAAALTSYRWSGYCGQVVLISKGGIDARTAMILGVDTCVAPHDPAQPLQEVLRRAIGVVAPGR